MLVQLKFWRIKMDNLTPLCPACGSAQLENIDNEGNGYRCLNIGPDPDDPTCGAEWVQKRNVEHHTYSGVEQEQLKQLNELYDAVVAFKNKVEKSTSYHHEVEQQKVFDIVDEIKKGQ